MIYIEGTNEDIDARVKRFCAPLWATGQFLRGGHDESKTNATVTFVQFESRVYAVTCHHVISAFLSETRRKGLRLIPAIHSGKSVLQFASYGTEGKYQWTFESCREYLAACDMDKEEAMAALERSNAARPDIAIADITNVWPSLQVVRGAEAINLDAWTEPDWSIAQSVWIAYGFPDAHKYRFGDQVSAPMPRVAVELASLPPSPEKPSYVLCSTLVTDHGWGFSGLSGGPVLVAHIVEDCYAFVGITFEGAPSSKDLDGNAEAFIGRSDIVLRGYHLTPNLFKEWLSLRKYRVELP